jgi:threonine/homoserine/homoserine lactone efflux protein
MGTVIADILPLAVGITVAPIPIVAVILLLAGQQGKNKGLTYLLGWLVGLTVLVLVVFLLVRTLDFRPGSMPSLLVAWLTLLAGVALLIMAYLAWRKRPPPGTKAELPGWLKRIHQLTPLFALGVGLALGLVNVKNLLFATAAATKIGQAHLPIPQALIAVLIFIGIATLGIASPVWVAFTRGEQAEAILADWEQWLATNNATILFVLCLLIGTKLLGEGLGELL